MAARGLSMASSITRRQRQLLLYSMMIVVGVMCLLMSRVVASAAVIRADDNSTVYEVLESYGFPAGLLPDTVESYELDEETGTFAVYLEGSCTVDIPGAYPVRYASTITGSIAYGSLTNLRGITVRVLLIRWRISSITVSGDDLVFRVGPVTASYPISNFAENPGCSSSASSSSSLSARSDS